MSGTKYVEFTFDRSLRWADYDRIGNTMPRTRHYFVTSSKNVSFRWYAFKYTYKDAPKITFGIHYDDGPLDKIEGVIYNIGVVKNDQSLDAVRTAGVHEYQRAGQNGGWGFLEFEDKDSTTVRAKYGLSESDRLTYQITMKIPTTMFDYCIPIPASFPCNPWMMKLYDSINKDGGEDSLPPDTKLAGRDGIVYNCHKLIVAAQSKALKTILGYPPSSESAGEQPAVALDEDEQHQTDGNPAKKRKVSTMDEDSTTTPMAIDGDVYELPNLCAASLKSVLEYLYTGKPTIATLTVTELIEMGDAGEQYDLKPLKEFSAAELWKRIIIEEPTSAFEIARFAHLHDEMKYLKHRALDVIAENYEAMGVNTSEFAKRFGGTRSEELRDELMQYMGRRLRPIIKP